MDIFHYIEKETGRVFSRKVAKGGGAKSRFWVFRGGGGGKALMCEAHFLGGLPPRNFLDFRCSEIASGAI